MVDLTLDDTKRRPGWFRRMWRSPRMFATLDDGEVAEQGVDVSVTMGQVAAAAAAAFKDMAGLLAQIEQVQSLPVKQDKATVLCYLCCVRPGRRNPLTKRQVSIFVDYVNKRYKTYHWLSARLAVPSFFFPVLFPIITTALFFFTDQLSDADNMLLSALFSIIGVVGGQLAGWIITGTQPNASSEAANAAQEALLDVTDDFQSYAYYLLDLYVNESPRLRNFASEIAKSLNTDILEDAMLALVPRPDPDEAEDPLLSRARFHRILGPLREVVAYIHSEGCMPPVDEGLRARIEVGALREQMGSLTQRLDLVTNIVAVVRNQAAAANLATASMPTSSL